VSLKHKLRALLLCLPLLLGSLSGMPMRPEDVDVLMESLNQQKIVEIMPDESENGDDTIKKVRRLLNEDRRK